MVLVATLATQVLFVKAVHASCHVLPASPTVRAPVLIRNTTSTTVVLVVQLAKPVSSVLLVPARLFVNPEPPTVRAPVSKLPQTTVTVVCATNNVRRVLPVVTASVLRNGLFAPATLAQTLGTASLSTPRTM